MFDDLQDDEELTQYGNREVPPGEPFRKVPRPGRESAISLIAGHRSVDEAARIVSHGRRGATVGDGVRYTTAGALREAGIKPVRTPTRLNPDHVSATWSDDDVWTKEISDQFDESWTEPEWKESL